MNRHRKDAHPDTCVESSTIRFEPTPDDIETLQQFAKKIQCEFCHMIFDRPEEFKHHLKTEHLQTYECNVCKATFNHRSSWNRHKKNFHIGLAELSVKVEIESEPEDQELSSLPIQDFKVKVELEEDQEMPSMSSQDFVSEPPFVDVKALEPTIQVKEEPIDTDDVTLPKSEYHESLPSQNVS